MFLLMLFYLGALKKGVTIHEMEFFCQKCTVLGLNNKNLLKRVNVYYFLTQ
jgi:hypothetical protein